MSRLNLQVENRLIADAGRGWRRYCESKDRVRELIEQARDHLRAQVTRDGGASTGVGCTAAYRPAQWIGLAKAQLRLGLALCALDQADAALAAYVEANEQHACFLSAQATGVTKVQLLKRRSVGLLVGKSLAAMPTDLPREMLVQVVQAIKTELGDDGWQLFDGWRRRSDTYDSEETGAVWSDVKVGLPALFSIAEGHGFRRGRTG